MNQVTRFLTYDDEILGRGDYFVLTPSDLKASTIGNNPSRVLNCDDKSLREEAILCPPQPHSCILARNDANGRWGWSRLSLQPSTPPQTANPDPYQYYSLEPLTREGYPAVSTVAFENQERPNHVELTVRRSTFMRYLFKPKGTWTVNSSEINTSPSEGLPIVNHPPNTRLEFGEQDDQLTDGANALGGDGGSSFYAFEVAEWTVRSTPTTEYFETPEIRGWTGCEESMILRAIPLDDEGREIEVDPNLRP
ncbi:hypothetical protein TREMEDRAFT_58200 [Tremella mesenterica DSM 1558]|uniref:uncharacterized protein n=1 Tax=Tremella mesenterica (strain ATCC 24925 / CBS 8224 / DSM 1558 / NBRC 9311 / NRRL Y-6157 / RJB 2259-6 / UBC 559-6) TaxID=578456 RepID=UPI0003F49C6E|nr:uncharacterized protein TREMEDRAFT_58200 [Tremella mesenterica DSM 1558]EIW72051.1 hypothetical protein TREMEDRAFT_58200 [Tremella mesenterica DSM 1558]